VVGGLLTGLVNAVITTPFNQTSWLIQAVVAAIATVITCPMGRWSGAVVPGSPNA
jgi:prolipoprotein diacylglyceryltransferase